MKKVNDYSVVNANPDLVMCTNCEQEMFVDCDTYVCPNCGKEGCLMDIDLKDEK